MSVPGLQWGIELVVAGFSAVAGAAALLTIQTYLRRGRFLRALQNESELNRNRLNRQVSRFESIEDRTGYGPFPSYHTGAYEAVRVNDPMLFISLQQDIFMLDSLYQRFNHLNHLSDPAKTSNATKEELLEYHQSIRDTVDYALESITEKRDDSILFRHMGRSQDSLIVEQIVIGEDGTPQNDPEPSEN